MMTSRPEYPCEFSIWNLFSLEKLNIPAKLPHVLFKIIMEHLNPVGQWIQPYLGDIALAIVAALLVIYGNDINRVVKRAVGKKPLILRFLAFIALCTFGYGFLTVNITHWLGLAMANIPLSYLPIAVLVAFIALAMLAERKNQV